MRWRWWLAVSSTARRRGLSGVRSGGCLLAGKGRWGSNEAAVLELGRQVEAVLWWWGGERRKEGWVVRWWRRWSSTSGGTGVARERWSHGTVGAGLRITVKKIAWAVAQAVWLRGSGQRDDGGQRCEQAKGMGGSTGGCWVGRGGGLSVRAWEGSDGEGGRGRRARRSSSGGSVRAPVMEREERGGLCSRWLEATGAEVGHGGSGVVCGCGQRPMAQAARRWMTTLMGAAAAARGDEGRWEGSEFG